MINDIKAIMLAVPKSGCIATNKKTIIHSIIGFNIVIWSSK